MRLSVDKSGKKGVLRCKGVLTIKEAEDLKKTLMRALKKVKHLALDMSKVHEIDISCLQLLCAAHKSAARSRKKLVLREEVSEEMKSDVMYSGYIRPVGCMKQDNCLWKEGGV